MQAIVIDPRAPGRLAFQDVAPPSPGVGEALIRVEATSVNRGEVVYRVHGEAGTRLGWDLAGVVERPAADGSGPAPGTRVVGLVHTGAWAELVAVPTNALAVMEPTVSFQQAAALPMAGLTALSAIEHGGSLLGRPVLVTGASGGVGLIACRLAALAGAQVVGQIRSARSASLVREAGAEHVVDDEDVAAAAPFGPYHLIVEQIGGRALAEAATQLAPGGTCVSVGAAAITGVGGTGPMAGHEVPIDLARMRRAPGAGLRFLNVFHELQRAPVADGLRRLVHLVGTGRLAPHIGVEAGWREIGGVARALLERRFAGKAVLRVVE